jgi:hypothetical protein
MASGVGLLALAMVATWSAAGGEGHASAATHSKKCKKGQKRIRVKCRHSIRSNGLAFRDFVSRCEGRINCGKDKRKKRKHPKHHKRHS